MTNYTIPIVTQNGHGIKEQIVEYKTDPIDRNRYIILHTETLPKLLELPKNCISVLLYLIGEINRDSGKKDSITHKVWGNLDKWFNENLLVTARTQKYISDNIGITQPEISKALAKLKELRYIKLLKVKYINEKRYHVWALGTYKIVEKKTNNKLEKKMEETYYYEIPYEKEDDF